MMKKSIAASYGVIYPDVVRFNTQKIARRCLFYVEMSG
ncbi:hypothetical protein GCHA_1098 [Paraglaciecola chathamensis S18K6]|uniref:Transposase n=2 Tax=Paraglaciecola chathamensis TaxID=368405 RepID=A0ABQ0ID46_9ALTE|nr:hypothetical protein GAGA_4459 [Paraglaciecola agarilytica NO2]GAC09060.1 hypothetical protein GCHA_1098 [Paraglaciecola chathamensis S18K6]